jgi:hypothetical protein
LVIIVFEVELLQRFASLESIVAVALAVYGGSVHDLLVCLSEHLV